MGQHTPRKRFGQNFLTDRGMIDKIVRAIQPRPDQPLVEIGPGQGALTEPLLASGANLQAVELDRDLVAGLAPLQARYPDFQVHSGDALRFDFRALAQRPRQLRVVGNLPYNISTPLIFHLLDQADAIADMHFMLQQEVVERLAAAPGSKQFGRLSVMVQYHCEVAGLFVVPPECFRPPPKVTSAVVRLAPYPEPPWPATDFTLFKDLVNRAFQQRRKTLRNTLRHFTDPDTLAALPVDSALRPDQLSVKSWVELANALAERSR